VIVREENAKPQARRRRGWDGAVELRLPVQALGRPTSQSAVARAPRLTLCSRSCTAAVQRSASLLRFSILLTTDHRHKSHHSIIAQANGSSINVSAIIVVMLKSLQIVSSQAPQHNILNESSPKVTAR